MGETEFSAEEKYQFYQRLMMAIFRMMRDARFLICYPYIIEEEEEVSLEEGMKKVFETLPDFPSWPKEKQIQLLNLRFGLEDGEARRLAKVAKEFEITRERIRQVEARILRVLRHPSRPRFLVRFLLPTPEQEAENLRRFKELEEKKEGLETTIQTLGEEIRDIREERKRLEIFLKRFSLTLEDLDPRTRTRTRSGLRDVLQRAALRRPGTTPRLVVIAYNRLVQNGIDSLSQLRAIMDFNEVNIAAIRNLGQKSFLLISQALEMTKKETN